MKVTKNQWIVIAVIVVLLIGAVWFMTKKDKDKEPAPVPNNQNTIVPNQVQENTQGLTNDLKTGDDGFTEIDTALEALS